MTFIPDPTLVEKLKAQPGVRAIMRAAGEAVKGQARQMMPRGDDPRHGHIQDRFVVVDEDGEVLVGNTDPFFHLAEFGSAKNPPYAPLRRGVRAAGLDLREHPKQ